MNQGNLHLTEQMQRYEKLLEATNNIHKFLQQEGGIDKTAELQNLIQTRDLAYQGLVAADQTIGNLKDVSAQNPLAQKIRKIIKELLALNQVVLKDVEQYRLDLTDNIKSFIPIRKAIDGYSAVFEQTNIHLDKRI